MGETIIHLSVIYFCFVLSFFNIQNNQEMQKETINNQVLPVRTSPQPKTSTGIPHKQINIKPIPEIQEELARRIYSIPGIEDKPSVVMLWQGLWLSEDLVLENPQAVISGRELGHIHDDGSMHIFLDPQRASEAIELGWAIDHPFAARGQGGWDGFVMLYTPLSIEELDINFELIVGAFNFATGQNLVAKDYY